MTERIPEPDIWIIDWDEIPESIRCEHIRKFISELRGLLKARKLREVAFCVRPYVLDICLRTEEYETSYSVSLREIKHARFDLVKHTCNIIEAKIKEFQNEAV